MSRLSSQSIISRSRPIKVIFLDFDGVLNSWPFKKNRPPRPENMTLEEAQDYSIDQNAIAPLNIIVKRTGAVVVVSSMWRTHTTRADLRGLLSRNGFQGITLDKTPGGSGNRGLQVREWLYATGRNVEAFVIIDDEDDFDQFGRNRLVQTSYVDGGLMEKHIEPAVSLLNTPWRRT